VLDAYQLGRRSPFLHALVPAVVESMKRPYPELAETAASTAQGVRAEEERFLATVDQGIAYFEGLVRRTERGGEARISGRDAFKLHATYGFPFELTEDLAKGRGVEVDRVGFEAEMAEHRKTSGSGSFSSEVFHVGPIQEVKRRHPPTEFVGYDQWKCESKVLAVIDGGNLTAGPIRAGRETPVTVVLDRTPFYGESGGQVGDTGFLRGEGLVFAVEDAQKTDGYIQHIGRVVEGELRVGMEATAEIDAERRRGIQRAHSATHILHWALHEVLGKHATQAGSKVEADLLRFDFHHGKGLSPEEIERVERLANERIMSASAIEARIMPIGEARRLGATALFGEKYGDEVRVVSMGGFSREFCGGCHLSNTGEAGPLKILREESISAGTRRITAATGLEALRIMREQSAQLSEAAAVLKAKPEEVAERVAALQRELKELQKAVEREKQKQAAGQAAELLSRATVVDGARVIAAEIEGADGKALQAQVNQLQSKGTSLAVLLASRKNGKVEIVTAVSDDLVQRGMDASAWIRAVAEVVGGKGGGKPQMARAGGTQPAKLPEALALAVAFAREALG
jgi:alanyl-tRNA synthetase